MEEQFAWDTAAPTYNDYQMAYFAESPEPLLGPVDYGVEDQNAMGTIPLIGPGVDWTVSSEPEIVEQIIVAGYTKYVAPGDQVATAVPAAVTVIPDEPDYADTTFLEEAFEVAANIGTYVVGIGDDTLADDTNEVIDKIVHGIKEEVIDLSGEIVEAVVAVPKKIVEKAIIEPFVEPVIDFSVMMIIMMMMRKN